MSLKYFIVKAPKINYMNKISTLITITKNMGTATISINSITNSKLITKVLSIFP